jgi:hypothetical protein
VGVPACRVSLLARLKARLTHSERGMIVDRLDGLNIQWSWTLTSSDARVFGTFVTEKMGVEV